MLSSARVHDHVAFPDLRITPIVSASEGSRTLTEVRIIGTNTGDSPG